MYNRYIRNDHGSYTRIPEDAPRGPASGGSPSGGPPPGSSPSGGPPPGGSPFGGPPPGGSSYGGRPSAGRVSDGLTGFLQHFLNQLHLDHVDTGDLLLLVLLFFLFREDADEELLVALGLLLIL